MTKPKLISIIVLSFFTAIFNFAYGTPDGDNGDNDEGNHGIVITGSGKPLGQNPRTPDEIFFLGTYNNGVLEIDFPVGISTASIQISLNNIVIYNDEISIVNNTINLQCAPGYYTITITTEYLETFIGYFTIW